MHNPCVIVIERDTREHMKHLARKDQSYDSFLRELLRLKETEIEN